MIVERRPVMKIGKLTNSRYEVTHYDGKTFNARTVTNEELTEIDQQSVDYFQSSAFGIRAFRTADGQWVEHRDGDCPGLGDVCIRIIQALQLNPGEFLTPEVIAELTGRPSLRENNVLSARLMAIRRAHQESNKKPHFFLSRRAGGFAVAWNPQCTWMWVDRI
jgi:hypothetical protein